MAEQGKGGHVLLTGANGFVACHILATLLERDFKITATVRSERKISDIVGVHPSWKDRVEFVIVEDITSAEAFDAVFKNAKEGFTYIIHAASPLSFEPSDFRRDVVEPAIKGTTEILKSAHSYGGQSLKRFVLLGSAVSVLNSFEDMSREGTPYTVDDWNPVTVEQAIEKSDSVLAYNASKKYAEQAAWEFMRKSSPSFDLTVICPDVITGPMIHRLSGFQSINASNTFAIANFINGTHRQIYNVRFPFYHFVDVRDVARACVDSLTNPAAGGQRILLITGLISPQLVVNVIKKNFPDLRAKVPIGDSSQLLPTNVHPTGWDMRSSFDILAKGSKDGKWQSIGLQTSVADTITSMHKAGIV